MKESSLTLTIIAVFIAGFATANLAGINKISLAAGVMVNNIWQKIGTAIFPTDLNAKVGIGTNSPSEKLSVTGTVESTQGGFKFPDGTIQTTAGDKNLHLYDANGQDLGILVDNLLTLFYNGTFIPTNISFSGFTTLSSSGDVEFEFSEDVKNNQVLLTTNAGAQNIYFDQSNCLGNGYMTNTNYSIMPYVINLTNGPRYFTYLNSNTTNVTVLSYSKKDLTCVNISPDATTTVTLLRETFLPFSLPLAWPLSIH